MATHAPTRQVEEKPCVSEREQLLLKRHCEQQYQPKPAPLSSNTAPAISKERKKIKLACSPRQEVLLRRRVALRHLCRQRASPQLRLRLATTPGQYVEHVRFCGCAGPQEQRSA